MKFTVCYNGEETVVDVTRWESTLSDRAEFYIVVEGRHESFINFTRQSSPAAIMETSSSADLTDEIKRLIKERLLSFIQPCL